MKPILFNTEMVRAILAGRKTATRRIIKYSCPSTPKSTLDDFIGESDPQLLTSCASYKTGDYLYVRETWGSWTYDKFGDIVTDRYYRADYPDGAKTCEFDCNGKRIDGTFLPKWHPSIRMPKEAAHLFLRVTDLRVERLQNTDDASRIAAEGIDIGERCQQCIDNFGLSPCTDADGKTECELLDANICNFAYSWNSTVKKSDLDIYGWKANPWVWAIKFERCERP